MGGKHKQAQRVKNNARPSSSGRSAELLGSSINPFVGFSSTKDSPISGLPFSTTSIDDAELNIDTNFQLVLKKMNKKDSTTKLKALQEFTELVNTSQPEAIKAVLSFWPRLYSALAVDTEHRVREATHIAHRAVVLKVKRDLAPYLKQLAGPWFTSQYDSYAPAASAASQSFQDAFPPNKLQEAIVFCQDEILLYICDNITVQTPQTLSNPKTTTPEDAEAKYERLIIASLQGYTLYLNKLSAEQLKTAEEVNLRIISNAKFWKLSKSKIPSIRGAWFGCIVALFQNAAFLLDNEIQQVTTAVFNNLDESEPSVLSPTWDAALFIISNVKDWWQNISVEKLVLPKLWKVLREAGQGSAVVIYPNLLPLISHFPVNLETKNLYGNFFENIRIGMKKKSIGQSRLELGAIATSLIECFRYIIMKNISDLELCESLITTHLLSTVSWSFTEETIITKLLYSEIATLLQYWRKNVNVPEYVNYNDLLKIFWNGLEVTMKISLTNQNQACTKLDYPSIINKHTELLLCLKRTSFAKQKKNKVKFMSNDEQKTCNEQTGENPNSSESDDNPLNNELNQFVYKISSFYLKFITENRRNELISALCFLMQNFESAELFKFLNCNLDESGDKTDTLMNLLKNVFLKFLKIKTTCFESVVDMVFVIYKYLSDEDKTDVLNSIVKLTDEDCFCWCVAKALSHPLCNDTIIQNWLSTREITKLLVNIASKMLEDEISPDKSLLLKQALSQNINGDLYISKEACQAIMITFCNCLLSPYEFPCTIDVCASFAAQLSTTLYTEQTLLTYGDQLILALFTLSCVSNYDPEIISKDTLWEVSTAWQDTITILITCNQITHFENIIWKFMKIMEHEFMTNNNNTNTDLVIGKLSSVTVDLIKCVVQTADDDSDDSVTTTTTKLLLNKITNTIMVLPTPLRPIKQQLTNICCWANILTGELSYLDDDDDSVPLLEETCDNKNIVKYFQWYQFIMNVICSLYKKEQNLHINDDDDDDDDDEDVDDITTTTTITTIPCEAILQENTDEIDALVVDILQAYTFGKLFNDKYKTTKLYSTLLEVILNLKENISEFLNKIISIEMLDDIKTRLEKTCYQSTYTMYVDLLNDTKEITTIYNRLIKYNCSSKLLLTQTFSKHLKFDDVTEATNRTESFVLTRMFLETNKNEVQIAEVLTAIMCMREKNIKSLLYNRNIINCKWSDIQVVIEIIRLLESIIRQNPLFLSNVHWDFIVISLTAWCCSTEKAKAHYDKLHVLQFISAVSELYVTFHSFIKNEELIGQLRQSCTNIVTEYTDIFAEDVHVYLINTWNYIAEKEVETKDTNSTILLPGLESVGKIVSHLEDNYLIQVGNTRLVQWQSFVQTCGHLLRAPTPVLQLWGYHGLKRAIPALIQLDEKTNTDTEPRQHGLLSNQLGYVLTSVQDVVQIMLMEFKLGEESCRVEPFTDSYTFTFGYLLIWDIFLSYCQQASNDLRYQYSEWLKSGDYLSNLLNNVFRLMPTEVLHSAEGKKTNASELFTNEPTFTFSDPPTSELLEHAVCWVYARALAHLPALVRQWWQQSESRAAHTAEQVTAAHVSPLLIAHELKDVTERRKSAGDNMRVSVYASAREVVATYTVDEARMELVITLPVNHPLGSVLVECRQQIGGTAQWRNWVMQLTVFLTHQNGRIWDGLLLWKNNLDKKFNGVEECYICFSVLHNTTYQLPKLSCQTCRKKFHSPCLYKWFSTSNKSTCPICRNLF